MAGSLEYTVIVLLNGPLIPVVFNENGNDPLAPGASVLGYSPATVHPQAGRTLTIFNSAEPALVILNWWSTFGPDQIRPKSCSAWSTLTIGLPAGGDD